MKIGGGVITPWVGVWINHCNHPVSFEVLRDSLWHKKVTCRKQIARQHSCHKKFWQGQRAWSIVYTFSSRLVWSPLIIRLLLVGVCKRSPLPALLMGS